MVEPAVEAVLVEASPAGDGVASTVTRAQDVAASVATQEIAVGATDEDVGSATTKETIPTQVAR